MRSLRRSLEEGNLMSKQIAVIISSKEDIELSTLANAITGAGLSLIADGVVKVDGEVYVRVVDFDNATYIAKDSNYGWASGLCLVDTSNWLKEDWEAIDNFTDSELEELGRIINNDPSYTPFKFVQTQEDYRGN
jgi:hypothetical protein